jgi:hypothetical protein
VVAMISIASRRPGARKAFLPLEKYKTRAITITTANREKGNTMCISAAMP